MTAREQVLAALRALMSAPRSGGAAVALAWPLALVVALVLAFLWAIMGDAPDAEDE